MAGEGLGRAELELATNQGPLDKGLQQAESKTLGFLGKVESSFKKMSGSTIGGALLQGVGLGAGLTAFGAINSAIGGAVDFMGDAIAAASVLNESIAKVDVVFGDASDEVHAWAETMAESFGISKQKALEAAGTYGNLFTAFGMGKEEANGMSTALVELAADLASFNNTSVDDALLALRSGLSGETEPLKRFGIAIDDARMRTELARQGYTNLGATLTPLQKTTAAYALILEDSANAQGDVARSSDNYAMQQKFLEAALQEVSAEIGQKLLPVMLQLTQFANETLVPALVAIVDNAEGIGKAIGAVTDGFLGALSGVQKLAEKEKEALEAETAAIVAEKAKQQAAIAAQGQAWEAQYRQMHGPISDAAGALAAIPAGKLRETFDDMRAAAYQQQVEYAKGLMDAQNEPQVAMDALIQMQEEALTHAEEVARLHGQLASIELAGGLNDEREMVREAARATKQAIIDRLLEIGAYSWGLAITDELAAGIDAGLGVVLGAAGRLSYAVKGQVGIDSEPKDPTSGLRGITRWGGNYVDTIAEGVLGEQDVLARAINSISRLMVPGFDPGRLAGLSGGARGAYSGEGMTGRVAGDMTVYINAPTTPMTERDIGRELRLAGIFG